MLPLFYLYYHIIMDTIRATASKAMNQMLIKGSSKPNAPSSQTILVMEASGLVAAHVLTAFLEAGYRVRGTVHSEETAAKVNKTHVEYRKAFP